MPERRVAMDGSACGMPRKPIAGENERIRLTHLTEKGG